MNSKQVEHLEITLALTPGSFDDDTVEQYFNQAPLNFLEKHNNSSRSSRTASGERSSKRFKTQFFSVIWCSSSSSKILLLLANILFQKKCCKNHKKKLIFVKSTSVIQKIRPEAFLETLSFLNWVENYKEQQSF